MIQKFRYIFYSEARSPSAWTEQKDPLIQLWAYNAIRKTSYYKIVERETLAEGIRDQSKCLGQKKKEKKWFKSLELKIAQNSEFRYEHQTMTIIDQQPAWLWPVLRINIGSLARF